MATRPFCSRLSTSRGLLSAPFRMACPPRFSATTWRNHGDQSASPCAPCDDGFQCYEGHCVPLSCDNVICPQGQVCQGGLCVDGSGGMNTGGMGSALPGFPGASHIYHLGATGFFLDQRENRHLVRRLARGLTVLNCFAFSGGFSVNAALGGAAQVFSVDQDADAVALARQNFTLNGLPAASHDFLAADVFELLASFKAEGRTFDLVILDPPAFAKSQSAVEAALDGYASLNRQALAVVAPGGLLCTASCSARVTREDFLGAVREGAFNAGVDLTLVEERYQPPDHPLRLQFPEGRYLKFLVLQARDA